MGLGLGLGLVCVVRFGFLLTTALPRVPLGLASEIEGVSSVRATLVVWLLLLPEVGGEWVFLVLFLPDLLDTGVVLGSSWVWVDSGWVVLVGVDELLPDPGPSVLIGPSERGGGEVVM